jgi:DUF971 family protein
MKKVFLLVALSALVLSCMPAAGEAPKAGDAVWAQWRPNAWYHGKATKAADVGLHIDFDDGDKADVPVSLVALDRAPKKNEVKIGTRTLALWTDGNYYPGTVTEIAAKGECQIQFDDGATLAVARGDLRVLAVTTAPARTAKAGDKVWAQWRPNAWYPGKVSKTTGLGLHVDFDDGDNADLPAPLVVIDRAPKKADVQVGTRVLGLWTDGKFYPATITEAAKDGTYHVQFDDGADRSVGLDDLRLLNE